GALHAMAGPFAAEDFEALVPADKRLSPEWVASLTARGEPERYSGTELRYIGVPIGGICCGQLYLGGDGRLWLWDIFHTNYSREKHDRRLDSMTLGGHYAHPVDPAAGENNPVRQGFVVRAGEAVRALDGSGFSNVEFRGEYPIGRVSYRDEQFPVTVDLEAFSPFIPLNAADSALPATVLRYTVRNTSSRPVGVTIAG
ncbi:MAG: glucosylceramidase, partial [bacterium]|nr:glucosylceramidase [bacterium]